MRRSGVAVIPQRHDWDCGIAALVMLSGQSYGDVSKAVRDHIHDPRLKSRGLLLWHMEAVGAAIGIPLRRIYRRKGYLEKATGILGLNGGNCAPHGHWVVMKGGLILDPSGAEAWEAVDYMRVGKCRPGTLLVRDE